LNCSKRKLAVVFAVFGDEFFERASFADGMLFCAGKAGWSARSGV
jgi:hypothetical protein